MANIEKLLDQWIIINDLNVQVLHGTGLTDKGICA